MAPLLTATLAAISVAAPFAAAAQTSPSQATRDNHDWTFDIELGASAADSRTDAWTKAGTGKLRYDDGDSALAGGRLLAQYRGRLSETVWVDAVLDYVGDASAGVDATEAYLEWRPLPTSGNRHHWRFGAFYPPLSFENGGRGWSSPLTVSYSAVNTWLGEEIRPLGAEWSMRRRLGFAGSPHELAPFAGVFYGNDPAGTLLFWRGWSLHDRQTRLGDVLPLPTMPIHDSGGATIGRLEHALDPIDEIDGRPGFYAGVGWRYAERAALQLARYDNGADPTAFSDGQWGWGTRFTHVAAQVALPSRFGLIAQWLTGDTDWIVGGLPNGTVMPWGRRVVDDFDARFVLLTRPIRAAHTVSVRYDEFEYVRPAEAYDVDSGHAWTLAYRLRASPRLDFVVEWLEIESQREILSRMFDAAEATDERMMQAKIVWSLGEEAGL